MKKFKFLAALCCLCAVMFMSCTTGTENGHEWVDLGLPSGTKWATCNVGATKPEEYGNYYAWGETETKTTYKWSTYKWCNGSDDTQTKYCTKGKYGPVDNKTVLELEDDAAAVNWGGAWRMPTVDEWTELLENCTWIWTTLNGRIGYEVKSKINGNSIFLPAAGCRGDDDLYGAGDDGYYWSSSLNTDYPFDAWCVLFYSGYVGRYGDYRYRYRGQSVRPVLFVREAEEKAHITEQEKIAGTKNSNEENHTNSAEESYAQVSRTQERTTSTSNDQRDAVTFRHESDVHRYLQTNRFVGEDNGTRITIYERSDMLLSANNVPITNAIRVVEFTGTRAFVRATSPYSSGTMEFLVDATEGYIYYVQDRQYFFKK